MTGNNGGASSAGASSTAAGGSGGGNNNWSNRRVAPEGNNANSAYLSGNAAGKLEHRKTMHVKSTTQIKMGSDWTEWLLSLVARFEVWQTSTKTLFWMHLAQCVAALLSIGALPLPFTGTEHIALAPLFLVSFGVTGTFMFYQSSKWPFRPVPARQMAKATLWHLIVSSFITFVAVSTFVVLQDQAYVILIQCCNVGVTTCIDSAVVNPQTFPDQVKTDLCGTVNWPPPQYTNKLFASWICAVFSVIQFIGHHCDTTKVLELMKLGLLFTKNAPTKSNPAIETKSQ